MPLPPPPLYNGLVPRNLSSLAPAWWDYTTLDPALFAAAAKLTPEKYQELSRARLIEPDNRDPGRHVVWSHPAFANKCIYVRNDKEIVCVSLAAEK